jgi:hypothetical protein
VLVLESSFLTATFSNDTYSTWSKEGDAISERSDAATSPESPNPPFNKSRAHQSQAASHVLVCLNLPPSLRHEPENMFLAGVIPGPREPSVEEVAHFIDPVTEMLDRLQRLKSRA